VCRPLPEQRGTAFAEQLGVTKLVNRVLQVEPAQQRVRRDLRRAQDIAPAIALDLGKRDQLADTSIAIAPDPAMNRPQHAVDRRDMSSRHCVSA
jgi:hypothetical protein